MLGDLWSYGDRIESFIGVDGTTTVFTYNTIINSILKAEQYTISGKENA